MNSGKHDAQSPIQPNVRVSGEPTTYSAALGSRATSGMNLVPHQGLGPIAFGATPATVRLILGSDLEWEQWIGGNLNDSLFYKGVVFTFDEHNSHGPLETGRLTGITVNKSFSGSFLGIRLDELTRATLIMETRSVLTKSYPNGSIRIPSHNAHVSFSSDGILESLMCWAAAALP